MAFGGVGFVARKRRYSGTLSPQTPGRRWRRPATNDDTVRAGVPAVLGETESHSTGGRECVFTIQHFLHFAEYPDVHLGGQRELLRTLFPLSNPTC
jgi:hypothetical protein